MGGCSSAPAGGKTTSKYTTRKPTHTNRRRAVFEPEDYSTGSDCADVLIDTGHDEEAIADSLSNYPHPSPPDQVGGRIKQKYIWYDDDSFNDAIDELGITKEDTTIGDHGNKGSDSHEENNNNIDQQTSLDFFEIDEHARKAGVQERSSFDKMFEYLNQIIKSKTYRKVDTARAIVVWLSSQNIENTNFGKPSKKSPSGLLQLLKEKKMTYASCYALLCRKAGVKCVKIMGYVKAAGYEPGNDKLSESSWNAVYVESGWQLVHPFWICKPLYGETLGGWVKVESDTEFNTGNKKRQRGGIVKDAFQERYFMPDPEEFIYECCAIEPKWQLVKPHMVVTSREQFLEMPYIRPPFFGLGFRLKSKQVCLMSTKNGFCRIVLKCQSRNSHMMVLRYELNKINNSEKSRRKDGDANVPKMADSQTKTFTSINGSAPKTPDSQKQTYMAKELNSPQTTSTPTNEYASKLSDTREQSNVSNVMDTTNEADMSRMVMNSRVGRLFIFDIRFSKTGEYKIVIFGGPLHTPALRLCETAIVCKGEIKAKRLLPISCKNVGWGPGPLSTEAELYMPSKPSGIIHVERALSTSEIKFSLSRKRQNYSAYMKGVENDEIKHYDDCLDVKTEKKQLLIKATVPHEGEFAVMINHVVKGSTTEMNVCNYLLTTLEGRHDTRGKERYAKRKLEDSLAEDVHPEYWKQKISIVEKYLDKCKKEHVPASDDFMLAASEELDLLRCKDQLRDCRLRRNPFFIRKTLAVIDNYKNRPLLANDIDTVRGLVTEIEEEEGIRHDEEQREPKITKASKALLKIQYPTKEMFDVIKALFLLVGEPISEHMEWRLIQSRFRKNEVIGNDVPDKIARIRPRDINHDRRRKAQRFIEPYDDANIRKQHEAIHTLYEWVTKTLQEK